MDDVLLEMLNCASAKKRDGIMTASRGYIGTIWGLSRENIGRMEKKSEATVEGTLGTYPGMLMLTPCT